MIYTLRKSLNIITAISILLCGYSFLFAEEVITGQSLNYGFIQHRDNMQEQSSPALAPKNNLKSLGVKNEDLTELQRQARAYRENGLQFQNMGDLDAAMALYQKAVELDPKYAVAYNDLGIVYEAKGMDDRAEESYLRAIKINPGFLSAYSNLALFYENKRDLEKAAFYWSKRVELGPVNDPWKAKARKRLEDIRMVMSPEMPVTAGGINREQEIKGLVGDFSETPGTRPQAKESKKSLIQKHFNNAKASYLKGDYATAFKEGLDAAQLDPSNKVIEKFIEKVQAEALSK